jgi:Glycosyltransferase family 87
MTQARRLALPAGLIALAIFVWTVPLQRFSIWTDNQINPDVNLYFGYARMMAHGALAYRDIRIEYPPGATGIFYLTWWLPGQYVTAFSGLMLACLCVCLLGVVATARALGYSPVRQAIAGGVIAVSPLMLGSLVQARFDLVVAAVIAWLLYAAVTERWKLMWVLLAAGVLIKLVPIALLPLLVIWQAHRVDWRAALRGAVASLVLVALVIVPFAAITPSGTWYFIAYNVRRPPQIESMASSVLLAAHVATGRYVHVVHNYGSLGLSGGRAAQLSLVLTLGLVVLVVACAVWCARLLARAHPSRDVEILIAGAAATMVALTVTGKVLSPQYMIWLLPVTMLVPGRYGRAAMATMVAAMLLTQAFFPVHYWDLVHLHTVDIGWLVIRNLTLIGLLVLCWPRAALGTLPIGGQVIGRGPHAAKVTGPPTAVSARHIVD